MRQREKWYGRLGKKDYSLIERLVDEKDKKLLYYARSIDKIDRVLGPLESMMQIYGSPTLQVAATILEIAELSFLKAPFVITYLRQTKDYDALYSWLPREIFALSFSFGDFVDISKAYHNQARNYFEKKVIEEESVGESA